MKKIGERSTNSATFAILKELGEMFAGGNGLDGYFDSIYCITLNIGSTSLVESDLAVIAGVVAGTATASKAVVLDANKAIDAVRTAALYLGPSGSETQVTATAAELNYCDMESVGRAEANKALVVDSGRDAYNVRNFTAQYLHAGGNGTAGTIDVYPTTGNKGKFEIAVTNQTGNTTVTMQVGAMGQATRVNLADPGAAAAYYVLSTAQITLAEADVLDGVTAGTVSASKALVVDANRDLAYIRNLTLGVNGASGVAGTLVVNSGANPGWSVSPSYYDFYRMTGITAGTAAEYKAVVLGAGGDVTWVDGGDIALGETTGTKIGTGTTQKLGFYGATPVVRQRMISYGHTYSLSGSQHVNLANLEAIINENLNVLNTIGDVLQALGLAPWVDHSVW